MRTAYLLGFVDTTVSPPVIHRIGIFSEDAGSITTEQRRAYAVHITCASAPTYPEAAGVLNEALEKPWYAWAKALLV